MVGRAWQAAGLWLVLSSAAASAPAPTPVSSYITTGQGVPVNIVASGNHVFVAASEGGVLILRKDFGPATAPDQVPGRPLVDTGLRLEGPGGAAIRAHDVALDGTELYVLDANAGELHVYDTSPLLLATPKAPTLLRSDIDQEALQTTTWSSVTARGGGGWLANGYEPADGVIAGLWAGEIDRLAIPRVRQYRYDIPSSDSRRYYEVDRNERHAAVITRFGIDILGLSLLERRPSDPETPFILADEIVVEQMNNLGDSPPLSTNLLAEGDFEQGRYYYTRGDGIAVVDVTWSQNLRTPHPPRPTTRPSPTPPFPSNYPYFTDPETVLEFGALRTSELRRPYHLEVERRLGLVLVMDAASGTGRSDFTAAAFIDVTRRGDAAFLGSQPLPERTRIYYGGDLEDGYAFVVGMLSNISTGVHVFDVRSLDPPTYTPTPTPTRTPTNTPRTPVPTPTPTRTQTPVTPRPADLNHTGRIDQADVGEFLRQWAERGTTRRAH